MPHGGRDSGTASPATAAAKTAASTAGGGRALRHALVGYAIPQMHATNPPGYLTQRDTSLHTTRHPWGAGERTRTHSGRADSLAGVARHRQWSSPHASDRPQPQGLSVPPWREQALGGTLAPAVTLTPRVGCFRNDGRGGKGVTYPAHRPGQGDDATYHTMNKYAAGTARHPCTPTGATPPLHGGTRAETIRSHPVWEISPRRQRTQGACHAPLEAAWRRGVRYVSHVRGARRGSPLAHHAHSRACF